MKIFNIISIFAAGVLFGAVALAFSLAAKGVFTEHFFILPIH